jgi:hypothetical protein
LGVGVVDSELKLLPSEIIFKFEFLTQVSPWCDSRYALLVARDRMMLF